jgi:hypothetical protein
VSGQAPIEAACCELFWCPTVNEVECPTHGGFSVCCEHPELHIPVETFVLAQRDVIAAARAYLAVPRKVEPDADGILRFDFLPQQEARKKLAEAVAAVVSGTPEIP